MAAGTPGVGGVEKPLWRSTVAANGVEPVPGRRQKRSEPEVVVLTIPNERNGPLDLCVGDRIPSARRQMKSERFSDSVPPMSAVESDAGLALDAGRWMVGLQTRRSSDVGQPVTFDPRPTDEGAVTDPEIGAVRELEPPKHREADGHADIHHGRVAVARDAARVSRPRADRAGQDRRQRQRSDQPCGRPTLASPPHPGSPALHRNVDKTSPPIAARATPVADGDDRRGR